MNDNDTVDNAVFNIKNITSNSLSTTINCDDSNNSNSSGKGSTNSVDGKHSKSHITKANSVTSSGSASTTTGSFNKKDGNSDKNSKSEANHHHHHSAFNSITQRLTNFSFGNNGSNNSDKNEKSEKSSKSSSSKRNIISLTGKSNNSNNIHNSSNNNHFQTSSTLTSNSSHANNNVDPPISNSSSSSGGGAGGGGGGISNTITSIMTSSLTKNKRGGDPTGTGNSIVSSYDPMKLIGTPACPRFDDCPVLEPLVCKKIAHERLTALIFREDCFLTACQDGFVYTWARPGYIVSISTRAI